MKRIVIGIFILTCIGWFTHTGTCQIYLQADDHITFASPAMDTLGYDQPPDSVTIYTYMNGVEMFDQTFTTSDPEASIANTNQMIFHDQIQDIDGAGGSGFYCIKAKFTYTQGEGTIRYATAWQTLYVYIGGYSRFMANVNNLDVAVSSRSSHSAADVWSAGPVFPTNFADLAITATTGRVSVGTSYDKTGYGLADGAITSAKYAAGAITAAAIATDAITAAKIATDAIGALEIATDAIGAAELASNCIGSVEIAASAISSTKLATGAITSSAIAAGALNGKGDWMLSSNFPTNFTDLAIAATSGRVTVGTSYDKTDYGLADGGITAAKIAASALDGKGDWTTTSDLDSLMAMAARTTAALYVPCDTSFTREYPLGQKPKDSICVYCVSGTLGADTTKVATWVSHIHSKSTSTENVIDSLSFDMK